MSGGVIKAPVSHRHVPSGTVGAVPDAPNEKLHRLLQPTIESFNYMVNEGLELAVGDIPAQEVKVGDGGESLRFWISSVSIGFPQREGHDTDDRLLPAECRERGLTYAGPLFVDFSRRTSLGTVDSFTMEVGKVPLMVRSALCYNANASPRELTRRGEDASELGGYFICNGIERSIRMLQLPRRNHIMAVQRSAFTKRGSAFSDLACSIRCVKPDQSAVTLYLHYLLDGNAMVRFAVRKQEFFIPVVVVLRALKSTTDREIYSRVIAGNHTNTFVSDRLELILQDSKRYGIYTREQALAYLGSRFRPILDVADDLTDEAVGRALLRRYVLIHLNDARDKLALLCLMLRKLYLFVSGDVREDNADALMNHELLLPGHLYLVFLKEKLYEMLQGVRAHMQRDLESEGSAANPLDAAYFRKAVDRQADIGKKVYYFLATGNLISSSGLDLLQVSGYTIVAEKLNFLRYMSHFRAVHRGQFFTEMKTTSVRKLLPESWGFLCPVHTPDGSPCGLLNHLAAECQVVSAPTPTGHLPPVLATLGMTPARAATATALPHTYLPVVLDGRLVGGVPEEEAAAFATRVRSFKVLGQRGVPPDLEICHIPTGKPGSGPFPGIFLQGVAARMVRPTINLRHNRMELVGPMEQVYLEIACQETDIRPDTTHREIDPTNILSFVASLTPFSDFNQSPRNMYQCQMGKQTMGTPTHNWPHRVDNKMYRIQSPQAPLVQTKAQREYGVDEYPAGTNAVVAVISYTGYDMEDAMILNKCSFERGFAHASVYKTKTVDLSEEGPRGERDRLRFGRPEGKLPEDKDNIIEADGFPCVGQRVDEGDPLYCYIDSVTGKARFGKHKETEPAVVEEVRLLGAEGSRSAATGAQRASIKLRFNRNPVTGDKFSSRHGQKGVMSMLWPQHDMPFTESGMTPDVIINPHAFPSRMTIGMLLESMAAKAGALHGMFQDATPFRFHEDQRGIDHFGDQLRAAGYNYYGSEPLYSGTSGTVLHADIYVGLVYYQRLRHMVSDKSQVRATGPINPVTRQPVKGRKRHGGIRFGEMERDSLLSHGTAYLMQDRLMNCSDRHVAVLCSRCGSMLSTMNVPPVPGRKAKGPVVLCKACGTKKSCKLVALPYVYRYLVNELSAMGIRMIMDVEGVEG